MKISNNTKNCITIKIVGLDDTYKGWNFQDENLQVLKHMKSMILKQVYENYQPEEDSKLNAFTVYEIMEWICVILEILC
jgi:glutathionyl-hydroquinone reductase